MHKTIIIALLLVGGALHAQVAPVHFQLDDPTSPRAFAAPTNGSRLLSNSIIDIDSMGGSLWLGTGQGLSELHLSTGLWSKIDQSKGIGKGGVSAIAATDTVIWLATAYTEDIGGNYYPAGGGVGYSYDQGTTWTWMRQPIDSLNETEYNPTTTNIQNVTYDLALSDSAVWITSWGGGLRRLAYGSNQWKVKTVDGNPFAPLTYYAHRAFSVVWDGASVWVGSAAGIHRSLDGSKGDRWETFAASPGASGKITGNFVVALAMQKLGGRTLIWAATWKAVGDAEFNGICVTDDNGAHWRVALSDSSLLPNGDYLVDDFGPLNAHNIGFRDSTVFVAADGGCWKSSDLGVHWGDAPLTSIHDFSTGENLPTPNYYSVATAGDSVIYGTDDGLAIGWFDRSLQYLYRIHRAYRPADTGSESESYAYPNPFSPKRHRLTRFQLKVTHSTPAKLEIYDFAMAPVYSSPSITIPGGGAGDMTGYGALQWDGRGDSGKTVANGVYFYRIDLGGKVIWGKVMVLD